LEESVLVSGESPLLDTTSALKQTVLSQEVLQNLPNRIDVWSITRVIPSVVANKVDVGGSESFQQSGITVHGTNNENGYYIDGMNVSSTQSSGSIATFYLDPYAFEEANFRSGNGPAEASTGGLVFNMISRTGTNRLHGGMMFNGTNNHLASDNVSGTLRTQLLRNVPASVLAKRPDLKPTADIRYLFDYGGWLAGPVKQDKLWFSTSFHHQQILQYLVGSYNPDGSSVPDDNMLWNFSGKLAWQMTPKSQLSWFYILQYKKNGHRASTTMFVETGATTANTKYPQLHQVKWTSTRSSRMVLDVSGSLNRVDDYQPWPKEGKDGMIAGFDQVTNTLLRILPSYRDLPNTRVFLQGSANYFMAAHDIKAGYQFDYAWNEVLYFSSSGMRAVYRNGVPDSVNTYNTPARSIPENIQQALYLQDKWRPSRKLTLNLGLRLDTNYGWMRALCQEKTAFVDARCFDKMSGIPNWKVVSPRFSAVYDLAGSDQSHLPGERYASLDPVRSGADERLRSQRRSAAADQRIGPFLRVQFRVLRPVRKGIYVAVGPRVLVRVPASASGKYGGDGRLYPSRQAGKLRIPEHAGAHVRVCPSDRHRSQQRQHGDRLQSARVSPRSSGQPLDKRDRARQQLSRHRHHTRQADEPGLDDDGRDQHRQDHRL
jgi:hypothetical protein